MDKKINRIKDLELDDIPEKWDFKQFLEKIKRPDLKEKLKNDLKGINAFELIFNNNSDRLKIIEDFKLNYDDIQFLKSWIKILVTYNNLLKNLNVGNKEEKEENKIRIKALKRKEVIIENDEKITGKKNGVLFLQTLNENFLKIRINEKYIFSRNREFKDGKKRILLNDHSLSDNHAEIQYNSGHGTYSLINCSNQMDPSNGVFIKLFQRFLKNERNFDFYPKHKLEKNSMLLIDNYLYTLIDLSNDGIKFKELYGTIIELKFKKAIDFSETLIYLQTNIENPKDFMSITYEKPSTECFIASIKNGYLEVNINSVRQIWYLLPKDKAYPLKTGDLIKIGRNNNFLVASTQEQSFQFIKSDKCLDCNRISDLKLIPCGHNYEKCYDCAKESWSLEDNSISCLICNEIVWEKVEKEEKKLKEKK